jgi:hypothetical protein
MSSIFPPQRDKAQKRGRWANLAKAPSPAARANAPSAAVDVAVGDGRDVARVKGKHVNRRKPATVRAGLDKSPALPLRKAALMTTRMTMTTTMMTTCRS